MTAKTPYRIIRNGRFYARRDTLDAAMLSMRSAQRLNGCVDHWSIWRGQRVVLREFPQTD